MTSGSRFRRSPAAKAGSLSQLGALMQSAAASPAPAGPTTHAFGIVPQDDDLACVWKVMSDGKGRTATELTAALADFPDQVDPDDVESLLRILVTNGFASQQPNRNEEPIYVLKKGVTMSMIGAQETKAGKLRGPQSDLQGMPTEGNINLSEGIKVCLWKVVADRKTRTTDQICDILGAYGINREVAKDAVIRAKVNEKWFDTLGKGESMTLKLKKHIKMPPIESVDPETLRKKMTPGAIRPSHPKPMAAPVISLPGGQRSRHHHFQPSGQPRQDDQPTSTFHQDLAPVVQLPTRPATLPVTKDDPLDVAIWKVMSDYKPYTASEVAVLLEEFGHNPGTVRARITKLHLTAGFHWFTREKKGGGAGNGRMEYVYTLNENVPMPVVQSAEPLADATNASDQAAQQLNLIDNDKEGDDMKQGSTLLGEKLAAAQQQAGQQKPVAPTVPPTPAPSQAPIQPAASSGASNDPAAKTGDVGYFKLADLPDTDLLKFQVMVRNTAYSFKQADKLVRELVAQGFGEDKRRDAPDAILKTAYRIGNASFTGNELEDLTKQLLESGFGVDE